MIRFEQVSKTYPGGFEALKNVSFQINKGEMIFIAGHSGSGKSTTIASLIDKINEERWGHVICLEDPIEFVHQHKKSIITQREVGVDTENWFAALKNTLRQAPDVILIGEIRDRAAHQADPDQPLAAQIVCRVGQ